jgi:hypothetical protein
LVDELSQVTQDIEDGFKFSSDLSLTV